MEHGPDSAAYAWMEGLTRTLLPVIEQTGVATAEHVGMDTRAARMRNEVVAKNAVVVLPPLIGAWTTKPLSRTAPSRPELSPRRCPGAGTR